MHLSFIVSLIGFLIFTSCTKKEMAKEELTEHVNNPENKLAIEESHCGTNFKLVYRPTDLLVEQELADRETSDSLIKETRDRFSKYHYFILSVSANDKDFIEGGSRSFEEFSDNLRKVSFDMYNYVYLVSDARDTIPLADFNTPRYFGVAKQTDILLAFEKPEVNKKSLELVVEDFGFNCGKVNFEYKAEDLLEIPRLHFN